ncbi:hypothetical protein [Kitasatospora sp. NBC_01302]|uniref:hypothetical protein n=1 Tax=Kitasatospora sp. NBC_01302 TaxID=2903575 RepID=UPI002E15BDFE|nr:hypothetical protein OG294_13710 [Kitasatospora sp. NBC_01302]
MDPTERTLRAKLAAHVSWANTPDPASRTAKARAAQLTRFEREVDPDNQLSDEERTRRAEHAKKAYYTRLALRSAQARRINRGLQGGKSAA